MQRDRNIPDQGKGVTDQISAGGIKT